MATKKTIAIIGATGRMGSALGKALAKGPYRLLLLGSHPEKLTALSEEILSSVPGADLECAHCPTEASWEADIIIPAVPYEAEKEVAEKIREVATRKIVLSISNPLNQTYNALHTQTGKSAGEELQERLPHAYVVKAFNSVFQKDFAQPQLDGQQIDVFLAGNDAEALDTVGSLVATAGFNPMVTGDIAQSHTLELMTLLLLQLNARHGYKGLAGWKVLHN